MDNPVTHRELEQFRDLMESENDRLTLICRPFVLCKQYVGRFTDRLCRFHYCQHTLVPCA